MGRIVEVARDALEWRSGRQEFSFVALALSDTAFEL